MTLHNTPLKYTTHAKYLLRFLDDLPSSLASCDTTRMTVAYFAISGLDILNSLDRIKETKKDNIIKWIYSLQIVDDKELVSGFQASSTVNTEHNRNLNASYKWSHLAATYCGLCSLVILGDDLSGVDRKAITRSKFTHWYSVIKGDMLIDQFLALKTLQTSDGCYTGAKEGVESDMRYLFIAASICYILNDWSGMDVTKAVNFIKNSISYDFGIAQSPELEAHGGSTYCAVATLALCDNLKSLSETELSGLRRWLLNRQQDGFQGRPNKPVDTCYSFWIGAALKILGVFHLSNFEQNRSYVLSTQNDIVGGFAKSVDTMSDPLHTYMGLAGLSLLGEADLIEVVPILNITSRAYQHLKIIQRQW